MNRGCWRRWGLYGGCAGSPPPPLAGCSALVSPPLVLAFRLSASPGSPDVGAGELRGALGGGSAGFILPVCTAQQADDPGWRGATPFCPRRVRVACG